MQHLSLSEGARRDFFTCLGIWLTLELIAFGLMPAIGFNHISFSHTNPWFWASVVLGMGGSFLLASASRLVGASRASTSKAKRWTGMLSGRLVNWVALAGVAFPLLIVSMNLFYRLFAIFTSQGDGTV
ncbi:hypothetical protein [Leptolyngbya sp. O-77]|uniref:hypothetical protein n=1 Tax=Leptolyngbya sp. O-77 TaxID=1080068 RepID=UPI00074D3CF0|nr:hypothetical protein [Leptolyngbya sp. O-77]BAU40940.1 hypothetical protein O77CONTIG1_00747 [Leptolyngbya sp. O-77]